MKNIKIANGSHRYLNSALIIVLFVIAVYAQAQTAETNDHATTEPESLADQATSNKPLVAHSNVFGPTTPLQPFFAQFDVSLNGKYIGYAEMELVSTEDDGFEVRLYSKATKGAAGFARARSRELARFSMHNGQTRSHYYEKEEKLFFDKDNWYAEFDWQQDKLNVDVS